MALLLKDNSYLKINMDGSYFCYKNRTTRNKEKKTNSQEIIQKYKEIIEEFTSHIEEIRYYAKDKFELYLAWQREFRTYLSSLQTFDTSNKYPLMEQYYPDIKNTIPYIIVKGKIGVPEQITTIEELYKYIKDYEIFGNIDEVKDI